jgi:hypothetical protein
MATASSTPAFYGLLAEFDSADSLLTAATAVGKAGYTKTDAFSPFPIHGLAEAIGFNEKIIPKIILAGGITGLLAGAGLEYWTQVIAYPMNIAGRPFNAWGAYIPPAFETTILFGSFAAVIAMLALNGLPQPYHPVFNAPRFSLASQDKFFLVIEAADPKFNLDTTRAFLAGLHPREVVQVED